MSRLGLLSSVLVACGPTVSGLCEELADECRAHEAYVIDTQECIDEGEGLESRADEHDCGDAFDAYLDCVDEQRCAWITSCVVQRSDYDHCVNQAKLRR